MVVDKLNDLQTSHDFNCQKEKGQNGSSVSNQEWPERKKLPPLPEGEIIQAMGEAYCKQICQLYPEVFDGQKRDF